MASIYTKDQITAYYDRIRIPSKLRIYDVAELSPKACLSYVKELMKFHLTSVPFENLSLHYSTHKSISLHPAELYTKIVERKRGGYCMELNATFGALLKSVGFALYNTGARVHNGAEYGPWDHMLNIISLKDSTRYVVDVGFGSNYVPIQPIRLINDTAGFGNVAPAQARLVFKAIDGSANAYQKLWVYEHRISSDLEWKELYCFSDTEFRAPDFEMMNWWTSRSPKSFFTQKFVCNWMVLGEDGEIGGTITCTGELKRRVGAQSELVTEFDTEDERVEALAREFGLMLDDAEKEGIRGTVDEIR